MTGYQRFILRMIIAFILGYSFALLYTNATRADAGIDGATNAYRAGKSLAPLATSNTLTSLAMERAKQVAQPGGWHHDFWWWDASGCAGIGENLAYRIPAPDDPASYFVNAWINSPDHHANLVGNYDYTGSAIYFANGGAYAVQLFGDGCGSAPAPAPAPATPKPAPVPVQNTPVPQPSKPPVVQPAATPVPVVPAPVHNLPDTSMEMP